MTEYSCRYCREGQVLTVLPLDRGNKSTNTLEDTFSGCMLGTSLNKLCHILVCILPLIGHRLRSIAYFCHCPMVTKSVLYFSSYRLGKKGRKDVLSAARSFHPVGERSFWLMICLICAHPSAWNIVILSWYSISPLIFTQLLSKWAVSLRNTSLIRKRESPF